MRKLIRLLFLLGIPALAMGQAGTGGTPPGAYGGTFGVGGPGTASTAAGHMILSPLCSTANVNNCFFVNDNVKVCMDGTIASLSATYTSVAECTFTQADVGKRAFVTNGCSNALICGFSQFPASTTVAPHSQQEAVIGTVNSASSITLACTGTANCSDPTSTTTLTGVGILVYGTDDTANLNAAWLASTVAAANGCPHLQLPQGMMWIEGQVFGSLSNADLNLCTSNNGSTGIFNLSQMQTIAAEIEGYGPASSILVPGPAFNFASCQTNPANNCIGGPLQTIFEDFGVLGFGQSMNGSANCPGSGVTLIGANNGVFYTRLSLNGWANRCANTTGLVLPGYSYLTESYVSAFGGNTIRASGAFNSMTSNFIGLGGVRGVGSISSGGGSTQSQGNNFYTSAFNLNATPMIEITAGSFDSLNDQMQTATAGTLFQVDSGAKLYSTNFTDTDNTASQTPITVLAGGIAYVQNWNPKGFTHTVGLSNAGSVFLLGGNNFGGPISGVGTTVLSATDFNNAPTITGTGACATVGSQLPTTTTGGPLSGSVACTGTTGAATITFTWTAVSPNKFKCPLPIDVTTGADVFTFGAQSASACVFNAAAIVQNDVITWGPVTQF